MVQQHVGKVFLVGAGPGAADLITMRGWRVLTRCDALVYDHLVDEELVEESRAPIKIYVGKIAGRHAMRQEDINALLVNLATRAGGPREIVRLKGGDPFVFGRGGEEAMACVAAGVPCEVIPGVTAGVAAPAAAGVPITHRELARGVVFMTGHMSGNGELELPWSSLASCGLTLVFFMAVSTSERIAKELMAAGMSGAMPAMAVQEGGTVRQRSVLTTLDSLGEAVRREGIEAPALLVIGKVASLAETLAAAARAVPAHEAHRPVVSPAEVAQSVERYSTASCSHPQT